MSHHYSPNSSILSVPDGDTRSASDVCDGTEPFSYANGDFRRGHVHFAAELGSAVEEAVASIVARHGGSGIDKSLAWEAIQSLARSKLDGLTSSLIAPGDQGFHTSNNFISAAETSLLFFGNAGSMDHDVPLTTGLDAFFQNEQPPGFENVQNLAVPELERTIYDDGPSSLWQMPIPSPSSGTITLPTNSPSLQEPWPDGDSVKSFTTDSTRTITTTPVPRRRGTAAGQAGQRLAIPQARHDDFWPQRNFRPLSKRSITQADRLMQIDVTKLPSQRSKRGRPSQRPSCARCKIQKRRCSGNAKACESCDVSSVYRHLCIPADFKGSRTLLHSLYQTRIQSLLDNVAEWPPVESCNAVNIEISNGFTPTMQVSLRPYVPFSQDALTHVLFRGTEAGMITPKAESTAFSLEIGLQEVPSIEGIGLVQLALRFWAMQAVFFKYPWMIVKGASEIGMSPLDIPGCWFGKTLLPRLVNQQLDKAFETRMDELEREILEQLQNMILRRDRGTYWCAIFLTTFTLLHSLEKDSWNMHAWEYEKNRDGGTRWPLRRDPCDYYGQNKHIADTLTTYFRIVTNGHAPFAIDWTKSSNQGLLGESSHARSLIEGIQKDLQNPQSNYGRELYALSEFRRDDIESLNYHYTKRLILG
ncbi:hypothetical protein AU210_008222 [Fusarium oxysporum f. sp. radicis-cucumerinum]|uniref:Zn(2)-C6 fungal-type domain-containing protein n=1 Tax=Fusarium oxysporum f. sp. radicis-cucumerinum TaxID=327505 RepID=A0A2H3H0T1_FUSOX|nr:hypothetical protein AU210_008222 [Fusarium oxysporum f. sp. radicis-cucumerinum]